MARDGSPRILIVRTDRIGDLILSTPIIRALRRAYPGAYLGLMAAAPQAELVEGHPDLDAVFRYDKRGAQRGVRGALRFIGRLRAHRFDTALILHSTQRVLLTAWAAGIPRRVGYARRLPFLLTDSLPYLKPRGERHELVYNLELLRLIGLDLKGDFAEDSKRDLWVQAGPEHARKADSLLRAAGVDPNRRTLVVLHPGASCPSKRWPVERFAALGDVLSERFGAEVAVISGPDGIPQAEEVLSRMRRPAVPLPGRLSLPETAALLKRARCLVSNDSGPVHLACAVGTPVVAIFGRWEPGLGPVRWGPTGAGSVVLHRDVGCRPCLAHRCPIGFVCLEAISVEEVLSATVHAAKWEAPLASASS